MYTLTLKGSDGLEVTFELPADAVKVLTNAPAEKQTALSPALQPHPPAQKVR
jgi:hypothetical protein